MGRKNTRTARASGVGWGGRGVVEGSMDHFKGMGCICACVLACGVGGPPGIVVVGPKGI